MDKLKLDDTGYANSNIYPWRSIGGISLEARSQFICTATLVGPRLALTNSHCVKDKQWFHSKFFFLSFNAKGNRYPIIGKRVRAKPWLGGTPTTITGTGKYRTANFSGTDWYLLVLEEPIGFEKGWMGVINTNGDIIRGHPGRNVQINQKGIETCEINRNPLANLKNKTPASYPSWWSTNDTLSLEPICLAGFPDKYAVAYKMTKGGNHDLIVSSNCVLRGGPMTL